MSSSRAAAEIKMLKCVKLIDMKTEQSRERLIILYVGSDELIILLNAKHWLHLKVWGSYTWKWTKKVIRFLLFWGAP